MTITEEAPKTSGDVTVEKKSDAVTRDTKMRFKLAVYDILCDFFGHRSPPLSGPIRDLLDREYWQRIWIIQEVVLARNASVVVAGNKSVSLEVFDAALTTFWELRGAIPLDGRSWSRFISPISGKLRGMKSLEVRYQRRQGISIWLEGIVWELTVAPERPHYSATEPRDILFGLLGILEESEKQSLRVDYSLSKEDVFINITTTVLDSPSSGPSCFCLDSINPDRDGTLPTWVPDWQAIGQYGVETMPISYSYGFKASAERKQRRRASDCLVTQDGRTSIFQQGCYVDKVTEVMTAPTWERTDVYTASDLQRPDDWFLAVIDFTGLGPEPDPEEDHIWRLLRHAAYRRVKDNHFYAVTAEVTDLWRRIMRVQPLDAATLTTEETGLIIKSTRRRGHPSRSDEHISVSDKDLSSFAEEARSTIVAINRNRTLFKTAKGRVGIGHVGVDVDDVVTLIWGASSPIVLKQRAEGDFYFGGDTYIDGMMYGEFLQTEPEEVEFRIF